MVKHAVAATFVVTGLLAGPAFAQSTPPETPQAVPFPSDARIAVVDLQAVIATSALGRSGQEQLKTLSDQKLSEIAEKTKAAQTLDQEIQSGQNVLAAAVLQQKMAELDRARRELQFLQEQAQVDYNALQSQLLDEFGAKVLPIIEQIRAERNLWVVVSAEEGAGLLAFSPAVDLSAEIVRRLDASQ